MTISFFVTFHDRSAPSLRIDASERARVIDLVSSTAGIEQAFLYTPAQATDPYLHDGAPPQLILQCHFTQVEAFERAVAADGPFQRLAAPSTLPSLANAAVKQQAMLARTLPVPEPQFRTPPGHLPCSYLVSYPGPAADLNAWLHHYITSHPPIMARFPGIRRIEIHTRIDWFGFLPWPRETCMLRNKVAFDDAAGLQASLQSPVRQEMRADYNRFPPFEGGSTHYPMDTSVIVGSP